MLNKAKLNVLNQILGELLLLIDYPLVSLAK
jgi:hypothetical protein